MHLVFIESVPWPYRIDAPFYRPIGGTQSAVCYLMMALAARGIKVSFINQESAHEVAGVRGLSPNFMSGDIADADAVIMVSDPATDTIQQFDAWAPHAKKILWQHHATDQPSVKIMTDPAVTAAFDAVVFVSEWQRSEYLRDFPAVSARPHQILRNAVAPTFDDLFQDLPILAFKSPAPLLAYSSTPFRGLDRLLYGWNEVLMRHSSAQLQIFSSMQLYNDADRGPLADLLDNARIMPGVVHVGPVDQTELAAALQKTLILAYPNTYPETSCIAVMQAMAAGCVVVTSDMGALPETLADHGVLLPVPENPLQHAKDYTAALTQIMTDLNAQWKSGELESRLAAQVQWTNEHYTWTRRAAEWEAFIRSL